MEIFERNGFIISEKCMIVEYADFILQLRRKIGRRSGIIATSRTGNDGLHGFVQTESTISCP